MTTEHTADAVAVYSRIDTVLRALRGMLEQENVQCARRPDVTALECVAIKLEELERHWTVARLIADADRQMEEARDERETLEDVRYG
jgi:hypothetical protein